MRLVMTLHECAQVLEKAKTYITSEDLKEALTLDPTKICTIRDVLSDCEPAECFTMKHLLDLNNREQGIALNAIQHVLQVHVTDVLFSNEFDASGSAYASVTMQVSIPLLNKS